MNVEHVLKIGLWIVPVILQLLIAIIMVRRGLVGQFRYFFTYCLFVAARDIALLLLQHRSNFYLFYFWIYWLCDGLLILLQLVVLCEVFLNLVPAHLGFRAAAIRVFQIIVGLSAAFACVLFAMAVRGAPTSVAEAVLLLERSFRVVQVIILLVVMTLVSRLGLNWQHYATGILLGSGIAGLQLVPAELRSSLHLISNTVFSWLKPAIYDCAVVAWAFYFIPARRPSASLAEVPQADLSESDEVLKGYLQRQW